MKIFQSSTYGAEVAIGTVEAGAGVGGAELAWGTYKTGQFITWDLHKLSQRNKHSERFSNNCDTENEPIQSSTSFTH